MFNRVMLIFMMLDHVILWRYVSMLQMFKIGIHGTFFVTIFNVHRVS